jgi:hypothetical protein
MHIFLSHKQNATYTERKILFKSQWEKQGKQKVTESSHMASASVNSLGNDVTCQGVSRIKLSPWSMWYQLNCFTAVIPCLSVYLSPQIRGKPHVPLHAAMTLQFHICHQHLIMLQFNDSCSWSHRPLWLLPSSTMSVFHPLKHGTNHMYRVL